MRRTLSRDQPSTHYDFRITHIASTDDPPGFNRAELVRLIDPVTPGGDYARLYGRRSDAESANNHRDGKRHLRRAGTKDPTRVWLEELGEMHENNAVVRARHQKAQAEVPSSEAA